MSPNRLVARVFTRPVAFSHTSHQLRSAVRYATTTARPTVKPKTSILRKIGFALFGSTFSALGYAYSVAPFMSTEISEHMGPLDPEVRAAEDFINAHSLLKELRANPDFSESRPHKTIPDQHKAYNLTGGVLAGPGRITIPPYVFSEERGKSIVIFAHLGSDLCGHPGIVHGGLLATLLDEGLARCCFPALPNKVGVTASLTINYLAPTKADQWIVLKATTTKVEGRKAWVEGHIETLEENPLKVVEAKALFIEPKYAGMLTKVVKVEN
ncbi:hypothetical protein G7K_3534-t1 [Saitoella complicata NRRL Y-17804]|uniref:Thioesterase domain-containing protein n=2 Tax=Saitoella complicata (strain BCRC 22490 / CBS 7301 / JCM 7358 / NBRC 10748 / NRRL Y-17804) TaxID=698492 RepID=A0A0E9NHS3_SAICN|nr:hypothetical protein G7K_3534-t1 [Saitoella complicata NRRL Y-17804]